MSTQSVWLSVCAVIVMTVLGLPFQKVLAQQAQTTSRLSGDFWKADVSKWGDGRDFEKPSPKYLPHGFDLDWQIQVPSDGWYELYLRGGRGLNHDVFVDGQCMWRYAAPGKDEKAGNLYLTAGSHTLKIRRVGRMSFPRHIFDRFELIPSGDKPNACIAASKTDIDVMRAGEKLAINVTAGGMGKPVTYTLLSTDMAKPKAAPVAVAQVTFEASDKPVTKKVLIDCPKEGAFFLSAAVGDKPLSDVEFKIGEYAVVDVNHITPTTGKKTLFAEIDCVANTINGKPFAKADFIEANGPSRLTHTSLGDYRESHDSTPPEAEIPETATALPRSFSGFSYRLKVPAEQVPYLVEVDFPDDTRRSACVITSWVDDKTLGFPKGAAGYKVKSYECGGRFKLSHRMQTHSAVVWSNTHTLLLSLMTQQPGTRAAASRIRIYRFDGDRLPAVKLSSAGNRSYYHWFEEANNWRYLVGIVSLPGEQIVNDMIGMDRWARLVQWYGGDGLQALGVAYQGVFWRTQLLDGFMPEHYDRCRLLALFCEKYGMKYMLEIFDNQSYFSKVKIPSLADKPEDVLPTSLNGVRSSAGTICDTNALHTGVQDFWVAVAAEIHRKLADSPAFAGVTARADEWQFHGDFTLPSIYWGYNDWIIHKFEQSTGIAVPGAKNDPERFVKRYKFLTASNMRDRWVQWRCDQLLAYHKRFRKALAGDRDDVVFGLSGDFTSDSIYKMPKSILKRAMGAGVDLMARRHEPGLIFMPGGRYGSRSSSLRYQIPYDGFLSRENVDSGKGLIRAFASYMTYLEQATFWPAAKLGINVPKGKKPPYFCTASLGAGFNCLEKYAVVLAEQDTTIFRDGGNTDMFGNPQFYKPWFDTFRALPAIAFKPLDDSLDRLAVWHGVVDEKDATDAVKAGHYFYAVNRTADPVSVVLTIAAKGPLTQLGVDRTLYVDGSKFVINLPPFGLLAYRAPLGTQLGAISENVPSEDVTYARQRLAFAQDLMHKLGTLAGDSIGSIEKKDYKAGLDAAWKAMSNGKTWRTVVELSRPNMVQVYNDMSIKPSGLWITRFPDMMISEDRKQHFELLSPMYRPDELVKMLSSSSPAKLVASNTYNADWRGMQVLKADNGSMQLQLDIPADGPYVIQLGQVNDAMGTTIASVNGMGLARPAVTKAVGKPETVVFPPVNLKQGTATLTLHRQGALGVYGLKVLPVLEAMPSPLWMTAGPFKSKWGRTVTAGRTGGEQGIRLTFSHVYPPEKNPSLNAVYKNVYGQTVKWIGDNGIVKGRIYDIGVDITIRTNSPSQDVAFARCTIHADRDRTALLYLPVDWWAMAYLNGQRLHTNIDDKQSAIGYDFTTHYPTFYAVMQLKKGENILLIKQQGGSLGTKFAGYITKDAGLTVTPTPEK